MREIRRAYSGLEAWVYERLIAGGVVETVAPSIEAAVVGPRVLDVGSGGGLLARRLRERGPDVIAVDLSAAQARRARGVQAPAGALPFRDAAFDSVVSSCSVKHWPDPAAGIAECRRVLRPGGWLVVVEMDRDAPVADVRRFAARTRVPRPLRRAYAAFDHRAVLPTALTADELAALVGAPARKLDGLPFLAVIARR